MSRDTEAFFRLLAKSHPDETFEMTIELCWLVLFSEKGSILQQCVQGSRGTEDWYNVFMVILHEYGQ